MKERRRDQLLQIPSTNSAHPCCPPTPLSRATCSSRSVPVRAMAPSRHLGLREDRFLADGGGEWGIAAAPAFTLALPGSSPDPATQCMQHLEPSTSGTELSSHAGRGNMTRRRESTVLENGRVPVEPRSHDSSLAVPGRAWRCLDQPKVLLD